MRFHKPSQYEIEQMILLGGQISSTKGNELFQDLCRLSPDFADIYVMLIAMEELEKEKDETKGLLRLIELLGMSENASMWNELTRLSAILGDKRERSTVTRTVKVKPTGTTPTT